MKKLLYSRVVIALALVVALAVASGAWIRQTPFLIVRDAAGFWVYLLRESI